LQYHYKSAEKPELGLLRAHNPRIQLPFEFVLDPSEIRRAAKRNFSHSPDGQQTSENWLLRKRNGQYLIPDTKNKLRDYLVVTRIPNWRERARKTNKNVVTILGGTHGVATNAVRLLLTDHELLQHIQFVASKYQYWQAVLEVDSMEYARHPYSHQRPRLTALSLSKKLEYGEVIV
jgi:hypothetical protein